MIKKSPTPTGYKRSGHLYIKKLRSPKTGKWVYYYARTKHAFKWLKEKKNSSGENVSSKYDNLERIMERPLKKLDKVNEDEGLSPELLAFFFSRTYQKPENDAPKSLTQIGYEKAIREFNEQLDGNKGQETKKETKKNTPKSLTEIGYDKAIREYNEQLERERQHRNK